MTKIWTSFGTVVELNQRLLDRRVHGHVPRSARRNIQLGVEQRARLQLHKSGGHSHLARNAWKAFASIEIFPTAVEYGS